MPTGWSTPRDRQTAAEVSGAQLNEDVNVNALVIGGGGREHAIAWKLRQSRLIDTVYCAPGNPGMEGIECLPVADFADLADFAQKNRVGLTVVGPEAPLCDGLTDFFRIRNLPIFGPSREAAQLEGSKKYAKEFMQRHGIPTAEYGEFERLADAEAYVRSHGAPIVVKADGLAAGKGVTVARTVEEALAAVRDCFSGRFGQAGARVIVEECLVGEEVSILAFTDGRTIVPLDSSQDHKAAGEGDTGPNTGGMGAYSPAPVATPSLWTQIRSQILDRFLAGIQADGLDYRGVIYAGLMVCDGELKTLEFNVRFGDPETQAVLMRLDSDLAEAMLAVVEQRLDQIELTWSPEPAVCVVMASGGYPGDYAKGHAILGLDEAAAEGAVVFHAGTAAKNGRIVTAGGRVLGVTARGNDLKDALATVYRAVGRIRWQDAFFRRDIGHRAMQRQ